MALDETMLILHSDNLVPDTVRIWCFKPTTVTIGRFLAVNDWINEEELKKQGIPLIRRFTGGGAVLHDENGELTWSIVVKGNNVEKTYELASRAIIHAIGLFGLKAEFKPVNDIIVEGKKITGMAGARKKDSILVHGTLMYNTDINKLTVLKTPKPKEAERGTPVARVTTLTRMLGYEVKREEVLKALIEGFNTILSLEDSKLIELELELTKQLKYKYSNPAWTYWR